MTLLKCLNSEKEKKKVSNQYPNGLNIRKHIAQVYDVDVTDVNCVPGYGIKIDIDEDDESIENVFSWVFAHTFNNEGFVYVADENTSHNMDTRKTLCRNDKQSIDALIHILTKMKETLI